MGVMPHLHGLHMNSAHGMAATGRHAVEVSMAAAFTGLEEFVQPSGPAGTDRVATV
jgi:hypothetical protein